MCSQIPQLNYFLSNLRTYASTARIFLAVNHNYERQTAVCLYRSYTPPEVRSFKVLKNYRGK